MLEAEPLDVLKDFENLKFSDDIKQSKISSSLSLIRSPHGTIHRKSKCKVKCSTKSASQRKYRESPFSANASAVLSGKSDKIVDFQKINIVNKTNSTKNKKTTESSHILFGGYDASKGMSTTMTCSAEALRCEDVSVNELAGYFEEVVHIPRKMGKMAEYMYA